MANEGKKMVWIHSNQISLPSFQFVRPSSCSSSSKSCCYCVGMVTPLGCAVETTWKRLIEGECGVRAICADDLKMNGFEPEVKMYTFDQLASKVAAVVPYGSSSGEFDEQLWLNSKETSSKKTSYILQGSR
ncbi:3-oxoacyl-[acyl-carrier-protein] synthase, mitochondrial-like isoform X3 [Solanum tuberosum]|uniref:3-oxoacyl-[acyl-carrier-protein] synthase, mitochondrial-like isoform X3 n=1 Tax=Solanum tuberosum TaxID=4113 RepID=UPI00073A4862|nr:PREDICTED: 3-oxoacyl-[acyl-carrier-protein] synthase, mitochondrial-like isoform X3 [Solanum tuberosum]